VQSAGKLVKIIVMTPPTNHLKQDIAWYKPTKHIMLPAYERIAKESKDAETHQDRFQSLFQPDRYTTEYVEYDLQNERLQSISQAKNGLTTKSYGYEHSDNGYFAMQHEFYNTLRALQSMFRIGVENRVIQE
jgi:hypothetical protein